MEFAISTVSGNDPSRFASKMNLHPVITWDFTPKEKIIADYYRAIQDKFFHDFYPTLNIRSAEDYWNKYKESLLKKKERGELQHLEISETGFKTGKGILSVSITSIDELVQMSTAIGVEISVKDQTLWIHDTRRQCER